MGLEKLLDYYDAALLLKISDRHLRGLVADGRGPTPVRLGNRVLFRPDEIRRFLLELEEEERKRVRGGKTVEARG